MTPQRVQQLRTKGWRKPPGAIAVHRNTRFGNPFRFEDVPGYTGSTEDRRIVVALFERMLDDPGERTAAGYPDDEMLRSALAGRDLMCWCPQGMPCHADVLIERANTHRERGGHL